jgi:hypothetical protein
MIVFLTPESKYLTTFYQVNHVYMDGFGVLLQANAMIDCYSEEKIPVSSSAPLKSPRELPLWEDILVGLRFAGFMVVDIVKQLFTKKESLTQSLQASSFVTPNADVKIRPGLTFTESYAKDLVDAVSTQEKPVRLCIPANTTSPFTRMKEPSCNHTALYYVDVSAKQTDAEFQESFKVFRSMTAKILALFLGGILSTWLPWLAKKCMNSVDIVYSNLHTPQYKKTWSPKVHMPVQPTHRMGVCTLTMEDTTTHTFVSRDAGIEHLEDKMKAMWSQRAKSV